MSAEQNPNAAAARGKSFPLPWERSAVKEILLLVLFSSSSESPSSELVAWKIRKRPNASEMERHKFCCAPSYAAAIIYLCGFVSEIEGELQVVEEIVSKLRVHIDHLQQIFPLDGAQVAVAQRSHVSVGLPGLGVQMDHFAEDVVLPCIDAHR